MFSKICLYTVFLTLLGACTSTAKKNEGGYVYDQKPMEHEAVCFIDQNVFQEKNLILEDVRDNKYIAKAADGKTLALPTSDCILKATDRETSWEAKAIASKEDKLYWMSCKLGPVSFMSDNLTYVADVRPFVRVKNSEGVQWLLPREHCKVYPMNANF